MWSKCYRLVLSIFTLSIVVNCEVGKISNFNANLREYSRDNGATHQSDVKTLQTVESARHADLSPIKNSVALQETQDTALASSNHIKGNAPYSKSEYALHDYEEHPPYGYGPQFYAPDLVHHGGDYHGHRYHGLDHHHRHYGYGLEKAILWPIAGLALLGAAAALVTNPILLQLGVVSGKKRRRRDTEEDTSLDLDSPLYSNEDIAEPKVASKIDKKKLKKRLFKTHLISKRRSDIFTSSEADDSRSKKKYGDDTLTFVPIPLKFNFKY